MTVNTHTTGSVDSPDEEEGAKGNDFLNLFCEKFGCLQRKFEKRFFLECVYPESRDLTRVINMMYPRYFQSDYALIEEIKHTTSFLEFKKLVDFYGAQQNKAGFFRTILKTRLSKSRLLNLARTLFASEK